MANSKKPPYSSDEDKISLYARALSLLISLIRIFKR